MANANNSIITGKLNGSIGKQLVFRDWQGKTIVAKSPKSRRGGPSAAQVETQVKFLVASRYAKAILENPDQSLAAAYAAMLKPRQTVYSRAMQDFMSAPKVVLMDTLDYHGVVGNKIVARAFDDFRVTGVRVEVYAASGTLLEAGNAVQGTNGIDWTYTATQANNLLAGSKIKAIATDVPGNQGTMEALI